MTDAAKIEQRHRDAAAEELRKFYVVREDLAEAVREDTPANNSHRLVQAFAKFEATHTQATALDALNSYEKFDGVGPHSETIETRARIGERYLEAYESALSDPRLAGYSPADCPSELLLDLLNGHLSDAGLVEKRKALSDALWADTDIYWAFENGRPIGDASLDAIIAALSAKPTPAAALTSASLRARAAMDARYD